MSGKKRIMHELRLDKIAAVDRPCQEPATMAIMKRAPTIDDSAYLELAKRTFTAEERRDAASSGAAMPDGSYPIKNKADLQNAIHAIGRGKGSHAAIRRHIIRRAKSLGATDLLPEDWNVSKQLVAMLKRFMPGLTSEQEAALEKADVSAILAQDTDGDIKMFDQIAGLAEVRNEFWNSNSALCDSVNSIISDDEVDAAGKQALLQETLQEFTNHILQLVGGAIAKCAPTPEGETGPMATEALKKSLGLPADATDAQVEKAVADALAISKMSAKHKAFMENDKAKMPSGGKEAFAGMTPAERDAHMKDNPVDAEDAADGGSDEATEKMLKRGEAFRTPEGVVITKAQVGEATFGVLKGQNDRIVAQGEEIAKAAERDAIATIAKRVAPLTAIGKADDIAPLLHKVAKADKTTAEQIEKIFVALNARVEKGSSLPNGLFGEEGSAQGGVTKASAAINAKAQELMSKDSKLSIHKARVMVRDQNPDLAKQEQEEARRAAA